MQLPIDPPFIPGTSPRQIALNIFFRPIRSWHSATFAGERLTEIPGSKDKSGCMRIVDRIDNMCHIPLTVTHRYYWNEVTNEALSVFLSYPEGMGAVSQYFWEVYPYENDIARFFSESEMEAEVIKILGAI